MDPNTLLNWYRAAFRPHTVHGRAYLIVRDRPVTTSEIQEALKLSPQSANAATNKLHSLALIQPSGIRRRNARGNLMIVWKATLPPPPPPGQDRGPGTGDRGPWTVDRGLWTRDYGPRTADCGL